MQMKRLKLFELLFLQRCKMMCLIELIILTHLNESQLIQPLVLITDVAKIKLKKNLNKLMLNILHA